MILFILSYYTFDYSQNASSYFQKFGFLEYGFKKGAQYSIQFHDSNSEMVFGFATKKEVKRIKKNSKIYRNYVKVLNDYQKYNM